MSELILNIFINGVAYGGMIAILAVGFSLVFGVAKIINMAHTAFYMVAAFIMYYATSKLNIPIWGSAVIGILLTSLFGIVCYRLFYDRIKEHETAVMIISIALALLFQEILLLTYGAEYYRIPAFIPGFVAIGEVNVSYKYIFAIIITLLTLAGLWFLLTKTRLGIAIRSIAQDREIANLVGIDVSQICMITMGISVALAGIAAAVVAPIFMVHSFMWMPPLVMVLAAVVLGGLGSIKGSVIAAFILGFAETLVTFLIPGGSFLRGAVSLGVMVLVLIIRPEGLFGVVFEEERL